MVNFYNNDFGLVSVIVDDNALSVVNSLANGNIVDTNGVTAVGTAFFNAVPASALVGVLAKIDQTPINNTRYNLLTTYFPRMVLKEIERPTTTQVFNDYYMQGSLLKKVVTRRNISSTNPDSLNFRSALTIGSNTYESVNSDIPFGRAEPATSTGTTVDYFSIGFLICDSNFSTWAAFELVCGYNNSNVIRFRKSSITAEKMLFLQAFFEGLTPAASDTDPYSDGGESGPGGGDGDFDFSSTDIPIPSNPSIGAMDTGFISLYAPSAAQLKSLANYMWAGAFDITQFKKLFADPMDAILGLHIIPTVSGHPTTGSGSLLVGNIDTGLTMPTVTEQYYEADFGTVNIPAKWGAYLDYSPYTKLSLYLPYIGFVPISPDDCMRGSIKVVYHVDILSGTCVAFVYCYSNRGADGHTLYIFNGSCSCDCPVTSGQYRSALEGLLGVAGSIGRVAAGDVAGGLKDAITNVTAMLKPEIGRSGSFGGAGGLMGIQYPYLVLTIPRMCIPGQQNTYIGYPSFVTKTIGDLEGYTSIDVSHLNNMPCTETETAEIISLLGEGVIL